VPPSNTEQDLKDVVNEVEDSEAVRYQNGYRDTPQKSRGNK
jgi:hypothetical protein